MNAHQSKPFGFVVVLVILALIAAYAFGVWYARNSEPAPASLRAPIP